MANEPIEVRVNLIDLEQKAKLVGARAKDGRVPLKRWFGWYATRQTLKYMQIGRGSTGGSTRGITWRPFQYQYIRKTDGALVPAWGGVKKLYGKGVVKARKRVRGRVTPGSWLMRDTQQMFRSMVSSPISLTVTRMRIGPKVGYAEYQHKRRSVCEIYAPEDEPSLQQTFHGWLDEMIAQTGMGK